MALSRKRRRELRKLRSHANDLLDAQRVVLGRAGDVLGEAGSQARHLSDEHLAPRVDAAAENLRPYVETGVDSARRAAGRARRATAPVVAAALVSTVRALDKLENPDAAKQVRKFGERTGYLKKSKARRAGGVIGIILGAVAAVGVGYALWQAFRSDDELWVSPEN
ncbi:hypothetical protein K8P10_000020 [Leucobacter sp. Psy1]|uniref:DNA/RNA helicase n=1 Tax=Leucobacter sp. Psy1 TaxID=2875729 RepID=UPI001CD75917|nr:DNA/RNA helicase [Leucobacter sp. Psy1]UBH04509.1 hypothetical protein K8P10_000020 [Leucobacter sp. Psy1]